MPESCFSYSPDMPPGAGNRDDPSGILREKGDTGPCFSYSDAVMPADLRRMPVFACFSYHE